MSYIISKRWEGQEEAMPILRDAVDWVSLRQWALSSVYRIILKSGNTVIGKWSDCSMISENQFYKDVLAPLKIEKPEIYASHSNRQGSYFIIQDLGMDTLESKPSRESFIEAVHQLARIHKTSLAGIQNGRLSKAAFQKYYQDKQVFVEDLSSLRQNPFFNRKQLLFLRRFEKILRDHVYQIYEKYPVTLVHNDYFPKNLVVVNDWIKVIDWTNARLAPLLSDLFGLIQEADDYGLSENDILKAYSSEAHERFRNLDVLKWLVEVGGVCWLIHTVRWILERGRYVIPGSENWVEDLMEDLEILYERFKGTSKIRPE